ncbi:MAG: hypothetical protein ACXWV5_09780 [Flavitalea sp.]
MKYIFTFLILALTITACSRKINFNDSTVVPAATGQVKVKKDHNNNYQIKLDLKHLADPQKLQIPKQLYVLWMDTEDNGTQNLGKILPEKGMFTSTIRASLETVTSMKPTRFFITAEDDGTVQYPGSEIILQTNSF